MRKASSKNELYVETLQNLKCFLLLMEASFEIIRNITVRNTNASRDFSNAMCSKCVRFRNIGPTAVIYSSIFHVTYNIFKIKFDFVFLLE